MANVLTGFLAANLLPIGEDDEKLKLLDDAATDLSKEIRARPLLAYRFAMVGFDEEIPTTDPVHQKVGAAIVNRWQTMTNKTGSGPVQVHRAVMLRALELACSDNTALQLAITLIAKNQPVAVSQSKRAEPIRAMLSAFESSVASEMNESWVNPVDMSLPKLSAKPKKSQAGKEDLYLGLSRAVGPQEREGKALTSPNPQWPNSGQPWSYEFAGRATDAIHSSIQTTTKAFVEDVQETLRETIHQLTSSLERLSIRDAKAELLWLRASLYSPSARKSYRAMDPLEVVLHSVLDINRMVSRFAPPSVDFFLRDLVVELAPSPARLTDVLEFMAERIKSVPEGVAIVASEQLPPEGRRSWLDYAVRGGGNGSFEDELGVQKDYQGDLSGFAVVLYRELQIRKLLKPAS